MKNEVSWENEMLDALEEEIVQRDVYEHAFLRLAEEFAAIGRTLLIPVDPDEILKESREYVKRRNEGEDEAFDRGYDEAKYWTENER